MIQPVLIEQAIIGTKQPAPLLDEAFRAGVRSRLAYERPHHAKMLPKADYIVTNPLPVDAVAYLKLIVNGIHQQALYEWLTTVAASEYQMQFEVLDLLIQFLVADERRALRWYALIRQVLGKDGLRGVDLVLEMTDVVGAQYRAVWVGLTRGGEGYGFGNDPDIGMLATKMNAASTGHPFIKPEGLHEVDYIWTPHLTSAFIGYLAIDYGQKFLRPNLAHYAHFLPLDMIDEVLPRLDESFTGRPFPNELLETIQAVLRFRRQMVATI